jgi:ribosomal protein S14
VNYDSEKYRPAVERGTYTNTPTEKKVTHLYELGENIMDFLNPMCRRGWNRDNGQSYSIFRGHVSEAGLCRVCLKRAAKGLPGVPAKEGDNGER